MVCNFQEFGAFFFKIKAKKICIFMDFCIFTHPFITFLHFSVRYDIIVIILALFSRFLV